MKKRISELDALRGIAALAVVLYHYTLEKPEAELGFNMGCMGVDLFFIISGFVIFMTVEKSETATDFIVSRVTRLYPAYWLAATLTFSLIIINSLRLHKVIESPAGILVPYIANLTMFQNYLGQPSIDSSYWTLLVEMVFYFFILAFLVLKKEALIEKAGAVFLLLPVICCFNMASRSNIIIGIVNIFPLLVYFPLFYAGILAYNLKFKKFKAARVILILCTLVIQCMLFKGWYHNNTHLSYYQYITVLVGIYIIIALFLFNRLGFITNKYTLWLGRISYSVYLIHQHIGVHYIIPFFMNKVHLGFWLSVIFTIGIICFCAHLINVFIEMPALTYFRKKYKALNLPDTHIDVRPLN